MSDGNAITAMRLCSYCWMIFGLVWLVAALRTKRTLQRESIGSRLTYTIPVVAAFYILLGNDINWGWLQNRLYPGSIAIAATGVALTAAGIAVAIWARFYIGQNWSGTVTIKVGHQLIRTGPYAWVRHPIYSGILLASLGTALVRREPRGLIALALLWIAFSIKSRREEAFMRQTFGPEYDAYSNTTGALLPRLHR
jgi:protein-S-isoprenylcysteine O-methyltransferase Ste14